MSTTRIGFEGEMSVSTDGGANFQVVGNARDVTIGLVAGESDSTTRANGGFRSTEATLIDLDPEFSMIWDPEDDIFGIIQDAFFAREALVFRFLDAPDGDGLQASFKIFGFQKNETLDGVQTVDVTMKVARADDPPQRVIGGLLGGSSSTGTST